MKYGILCAMEEELRTLRQHLVDEVATTIGEKTFFQGKLKSSDVVLVESGIGKVQAGVHTALLIANFGVDCVINSGSAGGIGAGLHVGDLVISSQVAYHDVDATAFNYLPGQLPQQPQKFDADKALQEKIVQTAKKVGQPVKCGLIVSGDSFVADSQKIAHIKQMYPDVLCCEMEGAAVGQVAASFNVPFVVLRAMSDTADEHADQSFDEFIEEAGRKSAQLLLDLVEG